MSWITKKFGKFGVATGRAFVVRALGSSHIVIPKVSKGWVGVFILIR